MSEKKMARESRELNSQDACKAGEYGELNVVNIRLVKEPVIYCQFDKEIFYDGEHQCKRGEFDYEKEGLGECVSTRDELVNIIIEYMKNDCKPKAEYIDRINSFFCFSDNKSSERVYRKIIEKY